MEASSGFKGFPKSLRLTRASEYQRAFDLPKHSTDNSFLVLTRANSTNIARLGLAISKKHLHSAVQRNRVKRLVRESFRHHQADLAGSDVIVLAQKGILFQKNRNLRASLKKHWGKIKNA